MLPVHTYTYLSYKDLIRLQPLYLLNHLPPIIWSFWINNLGFPPRFGCCLLFTSCAVSSSETFTGPRYVSGRTKPACATIRRSRHREWFVLCIIISERWTSISSFPVASSSKWREWWENVATRPGHHFGLWRDRRSKQPLSHWGVRVWCDTAEILPAPLP